MIELTADHIDYVVGKIWRATVAISILILAIQDFRHALDHSPFLFWQDATWLFVAFGVIEAMAAVDVLVRGPRAWVLVRVA